MARCITIKSRSKNLRDTKIELDFDASPNTLEAILQKISEQNKGISKNRLRLTYLKESKQVPITNDKFFQGNEETVGEKEELYIKDLGPQISYRLVFILEYLGPILVHTLAYFLSKQPYFVEHFHSSNVPYNPFLNKIVYTMILAHYIKREFESAFIHKFNLSTMPLFNLFKNSFHYWVLNGLIALSYFGYGFVCQDSKILSLYEKAHLQNLSTLIALFALSESWNFYVHLKLRRWGDYQLKKGTADQRLPLNEGIFTVFVAPNYTFEVWSWFWFTVVLKFNLFAMLFLTVSTAQMYLWAQKKNRKYKTKRAFLIPYIF
ncbi:trans-2-enoyl-CoA reductase (NADPH) TSC13 NDAI_0A06480 [Naumovozyma dairenensis CBS 421]|uniref:3-oxo-5-alpha-steroid 4-dehydrogenase C-terminal domain-containing protein n=1 Tax=Naumovozyma dairenensis (strain ATCC 10597 / BCRC 20456 / CBS 421 / NBRC 0211 / NRRL Y-12639) TaxID=1071378 RepID=G0W4R4_NAUDC|nr:hypothetical protein NDAI_0A06480 [Naumovozyma dairenensis CBS 421]CCD22802.1 hypothetical protein NDAI_0A06480 [Naumovozyma dairenensis CBS 421]